MVSVASLFGSDADVLDDRPFRLLLFANVNVAMGTVLVSPLLASITGPLGITDAEAALMLTVFAAPGVVGIPIVGVAADRFGRKPLLVGGLALFGVAGTAIAFGTSFEAILALRALQGVGFACVLPVIITAIGDTYEGPAEAAAQGFRFTSSGLTQALVPAVVGIVASVSWRYPFFLFVLALPTAVLVHVRFEPNVTDGAPSATEWTSSAAGDDPSPDPTGGDQPMGGTEDDPDYLPELAWLVTRSRVVAILGALGLAMFLYTGLLTYNSFLVVRVLDGTPAQAGILVTAVSVTYAVSASQSGRIVGIVARPVALLAGNALMALGLVGAGFAGSVPVAVLCTGVMGAGTGVLFSLLRSSVTGLAPAALRGGLVGLAEAVIRLTASVAPVAMGLLVIALEPAAGAEGAIRLALVVVGVGGGLLGSALLVASALSSPVGPAGTIPN